MYRIQKWFKDFNISDYYPLVFTGIFILIIVQYSFTSFDTILYDFWIKTDIIHPKDDDIIIVRLDQESDRFLGESYPYTFASHQRALEKIVAGKPKQINYLAKLPETLDQLEIKNKAKLDEYLASPALKDISIIMGKESDEISFDDKSIGYNQAPFPIDGPLGRKFSRDEVVRRVVLNQGGEDTLFLKSSQVLKNKVNASDESLSFIRGAYYDRLSDSTYTLFKYAYGKYQEISFHRLIVGYYPDNFFKDKVVIVGSQYLSKPEDYLLTPFDLGGDGRISRLQIVGYMIQALTEDHLIATLPSQLSKIISIILALLLSFAVSRMKPTKGLLLIFYLVAGVFFLSFSLFHIGGYWLDISYIIISIFAVYYIWVPFRAIAEYQTRYAIQKETAILKKVDHLKQNFISLMSHDLKTPVAKIAGIADILKTQYNNTDHQDEMLENVITSTVELNNFINSILDLTKIESQNFNITIVSKDINIIIESIVDRLQFDAKKQKVTLESELEPLYPVKIDTVLMDRVISNLVENALKYSGSGSDIIVKSWDDPDWVYVEVRDNGLGMSEEDLQNIFEKFYRVKNDSTHVIKGSGLGLYLVKYFVELHSGTISVTSTQGVGTSFIIKLKNE